MMLIYKVTMFIPHCKSEVDLYVFSFKTNIFSARIVLASLVGSTKM